VHWAQSATSDDSGSAGSGRRWRTSTCQASWTVVPFTDIARYWLTSGRRRPVFAGAKLTGGEVADSLIRPDTTQSEIEQASELDPSHALAQIALARSEPNPRRRTFLREFGFSRIAAASSAQQPLLRARAKELVEAPPSATIPESQPTTR
jgi:hypothetical protein